MTDAIKTSISVALAVALVACGSSYRWAGEWEGTLDSSEIKDPIEGSMKRVTLSVVPGKGTVLVWMGIPTTGSLETSGRQATFLGKSVMDQPVERQGPQVKAAVGEVPIEAVDDDTLKLTLKQPDGPLTVTLRRKAQPAKAS